MLSIFEQQAMLLIEENDTTASMSTHVDNKRWINHVVVVDEAGQQATEATNKSKKEGTKEAPTIVSDPPQVGGVKVAPKVSKERP